MAEVQVPSHEQLVRSSEAYRLAILEYGDDAEALAAWREEYARGFALGQEQQRERVGAIVDAGAARGHDDFALSLALDTDLSVEQARAVIDKLPKPAPKVEVAQPTTDFGRHLAGVRARAAQPVQADDLEEQETALAWLRDVQAEVG